MNTPNKKSQWKKAALLLLLLAAVAVLSGCSVGTDEITDSPQQGGTVPNQFSAVLTPTPTIPPTAAPTTTPAQNTVDWSQFNFGQSATNPPSVVTQQPQSQPTAFITPVPNPFAGTTPSVGFATPIPTSRPTATPKPTSSTLQNGSKGADVKKLQQRLKDLGYYTGSVDGSFGSGTAAAVQAFQKNNGLTADGKAGTRTLTVLYSSSAKKAPAKSTTSSNTGKSSTSSSNTNTSTAYTQPRKTNLYLRLGDSGSDVKYMQNRLIVLGYLSGTADGDFDENTEAAVKAFQKASNLWNDGVAGPDTLQKLYSSSAKKASGAAGHLGSLRPGDNGSAVRTLQKNLKTLGYYNGSIDGDYGTGTTAAVTAFQSNNGLTADGIAGKSTQNAILSALGGGSSSGGSSSSGSTSVESYGKSASSNGYTTISDATKSTANVTALQSALSATGYYSGVLDGNFGRGTEEAVSNYQRVRGLRVTGMAGPTTQRLLYGGTSESGSYTKLQLGSSGSKVKQLQYALYELKYYDGAISGTYDAATESAVMMFQECNGLFVDGVAGQDTQRRLYSSNAQPNTI